MSHNFQNPFEVQMRKKVGYKPQGREQQYDVEAVLLGHDGEVRRTRSEARDQMTFFYSPHPHLGSPRNQNPCGE